MKLKQTELDRYGAEGFLTLENVFSEELMQGLIEDGEAWGEVFLENLSEQERQWYVDSAAKDSDTKNEIQTQKAR